MRTLLLLLSLLFATSVAAQQNCSAHLTLSAVRPNPTDGDFAITVCSIESIVMEVALYNALGQRVRIIQEGQLQGPIIIRHSFQEGDQPGLYILAARVGDTFLARRVVFWK